MKKKSMDWYKQQQRFSVRKYHFGAASVLLGTALVFGGAQASADEVTAPATPSTESITATSAETTTASEGAPAVLTASEATPASLTASEASSSTEAASLDKGALQVALSQAKVLDLSNKTSDTVAILLAQIEHAQTVLNTATSQEELNQAVADLQAAQAQLADKPAQPVAVSPASVATTPVPATSTTSSTPEATTPASVTTSSTSSTSEATTSASTATVETTSSSPVVATPTRSRRTRRAVPTGTAPIEAVDAATQAAEKQNLENRNAQLKADYDAAVAHYNSELVRIPADNASKKATYDAAYAQYLADKKNYEDNLAANLAAAEATKNQPGHLSEVHIQHMKFDHEPNAVVDIQSTGYFREITGPTYRYGMKVGNTLTATYTGLENTSYNGRKITKVVYDYKLLSLTSPTDAIFRIAKDPTVTVYVETEDPAHALSGYSWETSLEAKFYYEDGTQVQFDSNKPAIFALNSLDGAPTYNEYVSGFSGRYVPITGSVIQGYPDGRQHANMVTATLNPFKEYMIATAGIANSGDSVKVNFGSNRTSNMYFGFNTKVESANLVQNTAVQPTVPTYETLPTAPTVPTYLTISNRLNYDPTGQDLTVKHNEVVNASDAISNKGTLPTGTTYTWKGVTPDTTTPGSKPATVTVGYPDGTSEDVAITVTVTPVSDDYTPVGKDVPAKHGDTPSAASGIANKGDLPADATYTWKGTAPDTTTPGDKPATVVVTYDDGTVDEVPVTVKVQPQADDYDPQAQPVSVDHGATPNAEDGIANKGTLPPGTTYDWKTPIDTSTPGTKPGTVVVTYPDGTKDEVPVPVTVGEEAALYTPVGQDVPAKHGENPAASQGIANRGTLPAGTTYDWKTPVDTTTPGDKPATVVVTYPDGSKDEVPVTVKVKPQSDEFTPNGQDVPTKHGETPNAADGIANKGDLPAGTTYDWKTPVDTSTPGDKPGTVVVTYPDGTKDEVPVTVKVKPQSDEFTPTGQDVPAKHGETPNAADGIANKGDLPVGTTYDWKTPVDTTTPGDKPGTVVVTYPDGTKDEVPVTVKVKPQSDEFTPTGQDVPAKHGETPNAADGIANKGDLPAGTTYDWKTPVDTTTPGDKPGTVVVTYPDGTKDEVPVTVKVKPQSDEFTPVGKDVPAKHGDTPNAADGISNKGDLPAGTTYDWKTPVDTSTPGDKPGTVVVTYPDGTKDEVPVTVKVQPQTDDYDPQAKPVAVDHGATPNAEDGIANKGDLPAGTTYDWKTPVDTSTPGTKPGTVVVTYPDGTKDEVPVPVTVGEQADLYTPVGQDVPAKHGETPAASQGIANRGTLPAGTTYDWKTPVDTSTPGDKPATVVVTYPDGTKDEVPVTVKVKPQSDEFTPAGQDVPTKHGETPNAADGIANKGDLPAGTTYDWKTPVDTSTPGDKPGTVVVTYPDGTKDEVPVTVKVKPQSDEFTPAGQDVPAKHGETPKAEDGIANKGDLPDGTKYDWKTPVDTTTPGDKPGTVVVTYPDGTKDEVPVTVKVKPQSDEFTPNGQDVPAKHGETPKAEDGIANKGDLPDGTKYDWKTPVDTTTPGDKSGTVVVTYPDGTKDEVPVTVKVKPQSDEFTPVGKDVPAKHGETPKAEDGIANKGDLPDGTKYDWKTPVDTTTPGDKPGTVVVTYPDGTKDEVPVTVKVKPQSDEFTPQPKDVSTDHGKTPKAEDGIANKGDLPDGTKYDWKTPVDTTTPGDKPGTVVVTYPDGTKDEIPVTVHVGSQSDLYNPDGQNLNVKQGDQPEASKGIANRGNLPDGTTYDWKTPVDTSTVGDKPATVVVTYPDGSKDEVPVTVKVTEKLHVKTPADKVPVKDPSNLTPDDINKVVENIKKENPGLPDDAKITVNPNGGDTTIETKDGDKVTIPGSDLVRPETDADKNNVKVPADKVPVKDPSNLTDAEKDKVKDNIKKANPDLPNGTKIDVAKDGTATITFPDGSTKVIPGSDLVRPEADADKNNVKVPADKVPVKDPSNLTDAEKDKVKDNIKKANPDLPNGTKIDVAKDGTATITFPDGSTKVIPGSDLVRPETDADRHTPKGQDVPVKQGETPKAEDGIANKGDLPNGTKIEWKETPDTSKVGDHNATIVITYPDGSKDEVTVTVKVSPNANNNGHNGNNGSHGNGTNGDQGQGNKDKKDQAGKDTNNGLDKLFSNSGNGSASGDQSGASRKQAPALPNTGDASNPAMALAFVALLGGTALAMKKRKKEEEE